MKRRFQAAVGILVGLLFLGFVAEEVRGRVYLAVLESEWPQITPGVPAVPVQAIAWKDTRFDFFGLLPAEDAARTLRVGDLRMRFSTRNAVAYDPTCGFLCKNALVIEKLTCSEVPRHGDVAFGPDSPCALHLWQAEEGDTDCFVSLEHEVGMSAIMQQSMEQQFWFKAMGLTSRPRDIHFTCPTKVYWQREVS